MNPTEIASVSSESELEIAMASVLTSVGVGKEIFSFIPITDCSDKYDKWNRNCT